MPTSVAKTSRRGASKRNTKGPAAVGASTVNVHAAKTHLSRLLERVERGERITIARAGKPIAVITPLPPAKAPPLPLDDPLLNLDKFGFDGPGGKLANADIDRIVYGA
jgi:prevent-host-death family protein